MPMNISHHRQGENGRANRVEKRTNGEYPFYRQEVSERMRRISDLPPFIVPLKIGISSVN